MLLGLHHHLPLVTRSFKFCYCWHRKTSHRIRWKNGIDNNPAFQLDVVSTRSTQDGIRINNRATHTSGTSMLRFETMKNTNAAFYN